MHRNIINVLLIEDDPMVQEVNRQFLEQIDGFQIIATANNGVEGIEKMKAYKPDLVLLDIFMPSLDGIETLLQIRKQQEDVDVIVITAANDQRTIRKMVHNGAIDYIIKPFKFERIKQALEKYRSYRMKLKDDSALSQQQLDELFFQSEANNVQPSKQEQLPKGLNETTLTQIISYLIIQSQPQSAEEVACGVGLARVTARRYLDYLKTTGDILLDIQYGGIGRPVNRYIMKNRNSLQQRT